MLMVVTSKSYRLTAGVLNGRPTESGLPMSHEKRVDNSISSNITLINVETKQKRTILEGDQAERYSQIFWNMEWSPDSRQICFKGKVKGAGNEMAIANVEGSSKGFRS